VIVNGQEQRGHMNMNNRRDNRWSRRELLTTAALAGTGALLGLRSDSVAAEQPPEITKFRLAQTPSICWAPLYMAEEFLHDEGFTEVQYIKTMSGVEMDKLLASGNIDMSMGFAARHIRQMDLGHSAVVLGGVHVGCFELFGNQSIRSIRDLKGKQVAVTQLGSGRQIFLAIMLKHVGLDPQTDVNWVTDPASTSMQLFADGKIDAFMAFPPEPQELRAKKIGHVVVNTMMDRPWSQYFCCVVVGPREFVKKHPQATKRALRAILKATDLTSREPDKAARRLVDRGVTSHYDYALQALKEMEMAYHNWRDYDPEDTLRFLALRLHEAGMIKSSPQKIIAQGTDWRFLRELKKEMKA
jgi:NitT/TauT family transport system substrate-binding protein